MVRRHWGNDSRVMTVCVDTYENGVPKGRFYHSLQEERFDSLSQFLLKAEALLDEHQSPHAYTTTRKFRQALPNHNGDYAPPRVRKGHLATFDIRVLFRQHTSWQGGAVWKEQAREQSFRSVLELVLLMDSALRNPG